LGGLFSVDHSGLVSREPASKVTSEVSLFGGHSRMLGETYISQ